MTSSVRGSFLDFEELITISDLAAKIVNAFGGLNEPLRLPSWNPEGSTEMSVCFREVLLPNYATPLKTRPSQIAHDFDCIGFMNVDEAVPWLPIWMGSAIYVVREHMNYSANVITWTNEILIEAAKANKLPIDRELLRQYAMYVTQESPNNAPELFQVIDDPSISLPCDR